MGSSRISKREKLVAGLVFDAEHLLTQLADAEVSQRSWWTGPKPAGLAEPLQYRWGLEMPEWLNLCISSWKANSVPIQGLQLLQFSSLFLYGRRKERKYPFVFMRAHLQHGDIWWEQTRRLTCLMFSVIFPLQIATVTYLMLRNRNILWVRSKAWLVSVLPRLLMGLGESQ